VNIVHLFHNNSITNTKGREHGRGGYEAKLGEGGPEKSDDQKPEESVKTRPSKEAPTLTWHPSQCRITCYKVVHCRRPQ